MGAKTGAAMLAVVMGGGGSLLTHLDANAAEVVPIDLPIDFGPLLFFDAKQAHLVHAFAEATLPHGPEYATPIQARVVNRLDEELSFVSESISADYIKILQAVDFLPKLFGESKSFTAMDRPERLAFLNSTLETDIDEVRAGLNAMRMAVLLMYYGHESTWEQIRYDGPFSGKSPVPGAQRNHYMDEIKKAAGGANHG